MARVKRKISQLDLDAPPDSWWECKGVFSSNYLKRHFLARSEYVPSRKECRELYEKVRARWLESFPALGKRNEAYNRNKFLEPTLADLGWSYMPEEQLPACPTSKKPDYCLFPDEETEHKVAAGDSGDIFRASSSVFEAKKWGHPLDQVSDVETPGWFPSQQIQDYLRHAKDNTGRFFDWAILSNGNQWRLYCEQATADSYFSFHLVQGNVFCPLEEFPLFVALFGSQAFSRDENGKCLLDEIRLETLTHQEQLEFNLRKRVFNVLEELADGFYFNPDNQTDESHLDLVYEASLTFLYRLLFILYAESRGLLPVGLGTGANKEYREKYSLVRLVSKLRDRLNYSSDALYDLYEDLLRLFHVIDGSRAEQNKVLDVTRYNGGLFDPVKHPDIEQWRVGNKTLGDVLRQLIFAQPPARGRAVQQVIYTGETVDFGALEVRQLGDIYEGLLGGHLAVRDGKRLELVGDDGQNHQGGVFYTPDWVVRYLVRETLQPLVDRIHDSREVRAARAAESMEEKQNDSFALGVLNLNIVDPAMGSGHFLVRATEWLAEQIVYHATTRIKTEQIVANGTSKRTREDIDASGRLPVSPGVSQEQAEIAYWRRRVVESCIFGVDVNPQAVELAKLSLWLTCIAMDEPLSFLDHHLQEGNSLIYATPEECHRLPGASLDEHEQTTVNIGDTLTKTLSEAIEAELSIEAQASTRLEVVKAKEERWKQVQGKMRRFLDLLDLWIAAADGLTAYGEPFNEYDYAVLALFMLSPDKLSTKQMERAKKTQVELATQLLDNRELNPFHWRLRFPSVFYEVDGALKAQGSCGFDAVLGNPPYVSTHTSSEETWRHVLGWRAGYLDDLYVHFTDLGLDLLKDGGMFGFIVSDTFFTLASKERMREKLQAFHLTHLGQCDPFKATVDAAMFVVCKEGASEDDRCLFIQARYASKDSKPERELVTLPPIGPFLFSSAPDAANVQHGAHGCLRVHLVPVNIYRNALKRAFFEPRPAVLSLYRRFNEPVRRLADEWWDRIETSRKFADNRDVIGEYHDGLVSGDVTLIGLVAEGGQGMRTANNGRFIGYLEGTPQADEIETKRRDWTGRWLRDAEVTAAFVHLLKANGGNAEAPTADNAAWEACVEPLKERFGAQRLGLGRMDLYRIVPKSLLATREDFDYAWQRRKAELLSLWKTDSRLLAFWSQRRPETELDAQAILHSDEVSDEVFCKLCQALVTYVEMQRLSPGKVKKLPQDVLGLRSSENYKDPADCARIATIYNGLCGRAQWVPFRKGDPEGNRWVDNEPLFIDWRSDNVKWLFANSGKSSANMPVIRNPHLYFTTGLAYTLLGNHVPLKARHQEPCVFDASASRLTPVVQELPSLCMLALYNSHVFSYFLKKFIKNTAAFEISDARMTPVVLPSEAQAQELSGLADRAIQAKKLTFSKANPSNELVEYARKVAGELAAKAPTYLHPSAQLHLLETAADCLAVIELAVNWEAEKLYGVEGLGKSVV